MKTTYVKLSLIGCLFLSFSTCIQAQDIKPYKAQEVKPYQAQDSKPSQAQEVKLTQVKETTSTTLQKTDHKSQPHSDLSFYFGLYQYWVPGTSYTTANYANQQLVLHNSAGTGVLPGGIRINKDGTYVWNSSWDGKVIKGSWRLTGDSGYPIELMHAQEGKSWRVGRSDDKGVDILVWDGSTWYNGKKVSK